MTASDSFLNWQFIVNNAVSFALGFAASFLVWYFVQNKLVPSIRFASELNKYELPNGSFIFRGAFENSGRRDIIDLEVIVRIGVKEFLGATGWAYHSIKTNSSRIPTLGPRKRRVVRIFDKREELEFIDAPSKSLRDQILKSESLTDILSLGTDATVQIHAFGYDKFSGSRRHFESQVYRKHDIRRGRYKGLDVVENDKLPGYRSASANDDTTESE